MSNSQKITISDYNGILAVIAAMLGFLPSNSLVIVCLNGKQISPIARLDLVQPMPAVLISQMVGHAVQHAESVILVTYTENGQADTLDLENAISDAVNLINVLHTTNLAVEIPDELMAATIMLGKGVLPSRDAVAASIAHNPLAGKADPVMMAAMDDLLTRDALLTERMGQDGAVEAFVAAAAATAYNDPRLATSRSGPTGWYKDRSCASSPVGRR